MTTHIGLLVELRHDGKFDLNASWRDDRSPLTTSRRDETRRLSVTTPLTLSQRNIRKSGTFYRRTSSFFLPRDDASSLSESLWSRCRHSLLTGKRLLSPGYIGIARLEWRRIFAPELRRRMDGRSRGGERIAVQFCFDSSRFKCITNDIYFM